MNNFIINNNSGIVPYEKNLCDIFKDKIKLSLDNNDPLSILIVSNFSFFEGFKKIYADIYDLFQNNLLKDFKIILGSKNSLLVKELLNELKKDATSIDSPMFSAIKKLYDKKLLDLRIYNEKKINIKMYVFQSEKNVDIYTGSAGLSGLSDEFEFLLPIRLDPDVSENYIKLFDELWTISHDKLNYVKPIDIIRITANENSFYLSHKEFISYMIKSVGKEYLVKNIGFDLSEISEFQHMSYYLCLEKLKQYGGVFLFNSAGSGKSDIAAMVAKFYKDNDQKVLLVHSPGDLPKWKKSLQKSGLKEKDIEFIPRNELYNSNFKYENYFGINLFIITDSYLLHHSKFKNNLRINFENLLKINLNSNCLFISDEPVISSFLDFTNNIKLMIKDSYLDKFKQEGTIRKISQIENNIAANQLNNDDIISLNNLLNNFSVNLKISDLSLYFEKINNSYFDKIIITQVKYAYDHEIFMKLYDRIIPFMADLNFEYTKLWTKKINDGSKINYYRWKIYKKLETSIYSFRMVLKEILEKSIMTKKLLAGEEPVENNLLKKEHMENIRANFEECEKIRRDEILINVEKDIKSVETILMNIENIRYLENKDDKITNLLKILRNENKPTLIFSESKETVSYVERRLKEYGNFKIALYHGNELSVENIDPENCKELNKDHLIESFNSGETDIFLTTDIMDEEIILSRAEILINFDVPVNPCVMMQRFSRIGKGSNPKKIKVFSFFPDKRIDKETEMLQKLNFGLETVLSLYGMDFINWYMNNKQTTVSVKYFQEIIYALYEYKELMSTVSPENLQINTYIEELNDNISLREFIKAYNISEDTIKFTDTNFKKPVYTCFSSKENGYFSFFIHKGNIYTINNLLFSEISIESEIGNDEIENIKKTVVDRIISEEKRINPLNFDNDEDFSNVPIGIIKYIKE
jgi:hypothetical protein